MLIISLVKLKLSLMIKNISRALKHKNYRYYFIWQFFSFTGTWIQSTAQSWLVYRLTESAFFLGAVGFAGSIPALFLAPIAGIITDSFNRRSVLIITQVLCLIQGIVIVVLYFTRVINEWHVLFLAIFLGIANSFDMPARQSFIPLLVEKEELTNAIALSSSMFNAARMIGPAISGFLIAGFNEGICFLLNIISYVPIIIFLMWVKANKQIIKKSTSAFGHLQEGFLFAWKNKPIRALLVMVGTFSFWGASFTTLMPIFSDQVLNSGAQGLGILTAMSGLGAVFGGIFLASRRKVIGIKKLIAVSAILCSTCLLIFATSKNFLFSSLLLMIAGFGFIMIFAGSNTLLQAMSPDNLRGRVISLFSTMLMGMFPLGSLTMGFLAHKINVSFAVATGAIVSLIVGLYFSYRVPALLKESKVLLETQESLEFRV